MKVSKTQRKSQYIAVQTKVAEFLQVDLATATLGHPQDLLQCGPYRVQTIILDLMSRSAGFHMIGDVMVYVFWNDGQIHLAGWLCRDDIQRTPGRHAATLRDIETLIPWLMMAAWKEPDDERYIS